MKPLSLYLRLEKAARALSLTANREREPRRELKRCLAALDAAPECEPRAWMCIRIKDGMEFDQHLSRRSLRWCEDRYTSQRHVALFAEGESDG